MILTILKQSAILRGVQERLKKSFKLFLNRAVARGYMAKYLLNQKNLAYYMKRKKLNLVLLEFLPPKPHLR